jgi:hypothetical protein
MSHRHSATAATELFFFVLAKFLTSAALCSTNSVISDAKRDGPNLSRILRAACQEEKLRRSRRSLLLHAHKGLKNGKKNSRLHLNIGTAAAAREEAALSVNTPPPPHAYQTEGRRVFIFGRMAEIESSRLKVRAKK